MSSKSNPAISAFTVVPSDSTVLEPATRSIYVGGTGDVKVKMAETGDNIVFSAVPAGTILPISVTKIYSTSTTATLMVGLY